MILLERRAVPSTCQRNEDPINGAVAKTNIVKNENGVTITIATPGIRKDQISITAENNILTITATIDGKQEPRKYIRQEFKTRSWERHFEISKEYDPENISATYEHGILGITIPKKPESNQSKQITIQ